MKTLAIFLIKKIRTFFIKPFGNAFYSDSDPWIGSDPPNRYNLDAGSVST